MPWIVEVNEGGHQKFLAALNVAANASSYVKVNEREKAKRFDNETVANDTAAFRGVGRWRLERVD